MTPPYSPEGQYPGVPPQGPPQGFSPQGFPPQGGPPPGPQFWTATEALGIGWSGLKANMGALVGAGVVFGAIAMGVLMVLQNVLGITDFSHLGQGMGSVGPNAFNPTYRGIIQLVQLVITTFLGAGYMKMCLAAARGEQSQFGDLFGGASKFGSLFVVTLIQSLPGLIGLLTLVVSPLIAGVIWLIAIVPMVFLWLAMSQANFLVVDRGLGPVEAIKESFRITKGQKGNIFLFWVLGALIIFAGFIACCVGVVFALPTVYVGAAVIYTRLTNTVAGPYGAPPAYGPPPGGFGGPPPGGYGPPPGGFGGPPPGGYGPPPGGFGGPPPGGYGPPPGGFGGPPPGGYGPPPGGFGGPPGFGQ